LRKENNDRTDKHQRKPRSELAAVLLGRRSRLV
jgi:hypothetical protein